jgi:hypothetical protein
MPLLVPKPQQITMTVGVPVISLKSECHIQTQVAKPFDNSEWYTLLYHVYKATLETTLDMDQCEHNQS